jgi:hypothetical protein
MEEDVLGTRKEVVGDRYTQCTRCGAVILKEEATLIPVFGPQVPIQEELCRQCRRDLESGEAGWVPDDLDETP